MHVFALAQSLEMIVQRLNTGMMHEYILASIWAITYRNEAVSKAIGKPFALSNHISVHPGTIILLYHIILCCDLHGQTVTASSHDIVKRLANALSHLAAAHSHCSHAGVRIHAPRAHAQMWHFVTTASQNTSESTPLLRCALPVRGRQCMLSTERTGHEVR